MLSIIISIPNTRLRTGATLDDQEEKLYRKLEPLVNKEVQLSVLSSERQLTGVLTYFSPFGAMYHFIVDGARGKRICFNLDCVSRVEGNYITINYIEEIEELPGGRSQIKRQ